jgi:hypothetical protein
METLVVTEVMASELYNILKTLDRPPMLLIHIWQSINHAKLQVEISEFMEYHNLLDALKLKKTFKEDLWL